MTLGNFVICQLFCHFVPSSALFLELVACLALISKVEFFIPVCLINVHRQCVKQYDDACPGPMNKKDRGIGKLMDRIRPESKVSGRKPSAYFISSKYLQLLIIIQYIPENYEITDIN